MILGIGSDIVDIRRIEKLLSQSGSKFEKRIFTVEEIAKADVRGRSSKKAKCAALAKRFAAKEACAKALGTGIGEHARWTDISVSNQKNGAPKITLSGNAAKQLKKMTPKNKKAKVHLSMADDYPFAQAFVVISA